MTQETWERSSNSAYSHLCTSGSVWMIFLMKVWLWAAAKAAIFCLESTSPWLQTLLMAFSRSAEKMNSNYLFMHTESVGCSLTAGGWRGHTESRSQEDKQLIMPNNISSLYLKRGTTWFYKRQDSVFPHTLPSVFSHDATWCEGSLNLPACLCESLLLFTCFCDTTQSSLTSLTSLTLFLPIKRESRDLAIVLVS